AESGRRAVAAAEEHGERWCRSYALWALGHDAWVRGDGPSALAFARLVLGGGFLGMKIASAGQAQRGPRSRLRWPRPRAGHATAAPGPVPRLQAAGGRLTS
ncbi:hypothetical protein, partial [Streptomyces ipomoeae]